MAGREGICTHHPGHLLGDVAYHVRHEVKIRASIRPRAGLVPWSLRASGLVDLHDRAVRTHDAWTARRIVEGFGRARPDEDCILVDGDGVRTAELESERARACAVFV